MFTKDDLIDLIVAHLKGAAAPASEPLPEEKMHPNSMLPRGRIFLSEFEIKKRLTVSGQHLTIPKDSIVSPLALDWLVLKGIKIVRE